MDPEEIKKQISELGEDIKEGREELKKNIDDHDEVLKDVQNDLTEMEKEKTELEEKLRELESDIAEGNRLSGDKDNDEKEDFGFDNVGEFVNKAVHTSVDNIKDERLKDVAEYMEKDLEMDPGSAGGFLVPPKFGEMLDMFEPQEGIFRGRANVIPPGEQPDASIDFPALDQSTSDGVYAGVAVEWLEEGESKPETDFNFRDVSLEPSEVAGYIPMTDKLLRNAPEVAGTVNQLLTWALRQAEDDAFMSGDGAGKPQGVIGHDATITVTRNSAGSVEYTDLVTMFSNILSNGNYIWTINQTVLPDLMEMESTGGNQLWQPNAREDMPGTLFGLPVLFNQRQPTIGNEGDIALMDLSYYIIKDGAGPIISSSEHVEFLKNKTVIKAFMSVDGQPAVTDSLTLEDGSTTVSPFITLDQNTA